MTAALLAFLQRLPRPPVLGKQFPLVLQLWHYVEPLCGSGTLWHELGVSFSISTRLERGR